MVTEETKKKILRQLTLKPRKLIHGENIKDSDGLYGDGKGVWGDGTGKWGDVTDITGDISGIGSGDLSRFVGNINGIQASVPEIIALLESTGKVIKHRAV